MNGGRTKVFFYTVLTNPAGCRSWRGFPIVLREHHVLITFTTGQTKTRDGSVRCR